MKRVFALGLLLGAVFGLWDLIVTGLNPLAEDDMGRHPNPPRPRKIPAQAARIVTFRYGAAQRKENQLF